MTAQPDLFAVSTPRHELADALASVDCADPAEAIWRKMHEPGCGFGICGNAEWQTVHGFGVSAGGRSRGAAARAWVDAARIALGGGRMTIHAITLRPGDAVQAQEIRPAGGFQIVLADPPWNFSGNSRDKPGRNARRHYGTMPLADIEALPIKPMAASNALLLLWVTVPFAEHGFKVLRSWGFRYASQLVWPKSRIGTGYWARNKHEIVLIGRRGRFPCEMPALFPTSIIPGAQGRHSAKPDWLHEVIDARFPEAAKVEIFARAPRAGWTSIGNQLPTEPET